MGASGRPALDTVREDDREYFASRQEKADAILADIRAAGFPDIGGRSISVLEVGANSCFIARRLASVTRWDIHCLEIEADRLLKYPEICRSFKSLLADATAIPFEDGSFDLVFCNHTLEHIVPYEACISEMLRVTRKGGLLYLAFPNRDRLIDEIGLSWTKTKGNLAWYFDRAFRAFTIESRVRRHIGLGRGQIKAACAGHKVACLSRGHATRSLGGTARGIAGRVPAGFFDRFSPVGVYLVEKR